MSNEIQIKLQNIEDDLKDTLALAVNKNYSQLNITAIALCRDAVKSAIKQINISIREGNLR